MNTVPHGTQMKRGRGLQLCTEPSIISNLGNTRNKDEQKILKIHFEEKVLDLSRLRAKRILGKRPIFRV